MKINKKVVGIIATDIDGAIAKQGLLPWHYPSEEEFFNKTTFNQVVIMGETTFKCTPMVYPQFLFERFNIVFSYNLKNSDAVPNVHFVKSIEDFLDFINNLTLPNNRKIYLVGGSQVASLFLKHNLLDEFLLTTIKKKYEGDIFFHDRVKVQEWPFETVLDTEDYIINRHSNLQSLYKKR